MALISAGVPIPSELVLPFAGYLVTQGKFTLVGAATAAMLGENVGAAIDPKLALLESLHPFDLHGVEWAEARTIRQRACRAGNSSGRAQPGRARRCHHELPHSGHDPSEVRWLCQMLERKQCKPLEPMPWSPLPDDWEGRCRWGHPRAF